MKIFIDTAPFIYLIENHPKYAPVVANLLVDKLNQGDELLSSVVTLMEFGVKPAQENKLEINAKFEEFLEKLNIFLLDVNRDIARKAYELRAKYPHLKAMDSLQLASALLADCELFITNDKRLLNIQEIKVIILD